MAAILKMRGWLTCGLQQRNIARGVGTAATSNTITPRAKLAFKTAAADCTRARRQRGRTVLGLPLCLLRAEPFLLLLVCVPTPIINYSHNATATARVVGGRIVSYSPLWAPPITLQHRGALAPIQPSTAYHANGYPYNFIDP